MWAIRKLGAEPGLDLVETPVPTIGDDDVLVRVEAASLCGTDLHIFHWDEWAANRISLRSRSATNSPGRCRGWRKSVHTSPGTTSRPRATSRAACASTAAPARRTCARDADPRRRPRRRLRGVRGRARVRDLAQRPIKLAPEIATLQEPSATRSSRQLTGPGREVGRGPRVRPRRALHHRDCARLGAGRVLASDQPLPPGARVHDGRHGSRQGRPGPGSPGLVRGSKRGQHLDVVFEMSGAPARDRDSFKSCGTEATWCCSESRPAPSRWTSRSRSSSRT